MPAMLLKLFVTLPATAGVVWVCRPLPGGVCTHRRIGVAPWYDEPLRARTELTRLWVLCRTFLQVMWTSVRLSSFWMTQTMKKKTPASNKHADVNVKAETKMTEPTNWNTVRELQWRIYKSAVSP